MKSVVTEKAMGAAAQGVYTFKTSRRQTKSKIKRLVEDRFKVRVAKVRITNVKKKKSWKKAIVQLKEGQKIEGFGEEK